LNSACLNSICVELFEENAMRIVPPTMRVPAKRPSPYDSPTAAVFYGGLLGFALLAGCAGSGDGLDQNGRPSTPGSAGTALTADFKSIQDNVFTPVCTRCHAGATAPRGLQLDAANSYALLVGVASSEVPGIQRIQAGNPSASYLIQKISGTAAVGQRMPLGGPPLPQSTIDVIAQWVRNGAPKPAAIVAVSQKTDLLGDLGLQIATTAPLDGSRSDDPIVQIVVGFDRELDVSLANASTVELIDTASGSNVPARLSVPLANPSTLLVTPSVPLAAGNFQLTLRGSGGGALAGLDARVLNAPAGAAEGSDTTINFTVTTSPKVQP
jgi:hypothetical protein